MRLQGNDPSRALSSSTIHVAHSLEDDRWHVRETQSQKETSHLTKEEALDTAKAIARQKKEAYVVVHKDEGSLERIVS